MTERCAGCSIYENGAVCREVLTEYRGQKLCSWCSLNWQKIEKWLGRPVEFEEYRRASHHSYPKSLPSVEARRQRNEKIIQAIREGKTGVEIATEFGLTQSMVYRIIRDFS